MLFNSYAFLLVFLPTALVIYRIVDGYPQLRTSTLMVSLLFYGYWNPWFLILLVGSILVNWLVSQAYAARPNRAIVRAAIVLNLAVLGFFKYANFFIDNVAFMFALPIVHLDLALPLGISFFTFHHVMYLVDLREGRAETASLERYALYICFFPQAIAGPIARWSEVGRQYGRQVFVPGWERRAAIGVTLLVFGLIEKIMLGDPLGRVLDPIYADASAGPPSDGSAWFAIGFGLQVFFDFAGYSDMAIGLGLLFGIELPPNFNMPFRATNIQEFWQRWHMTLTRFLRDYVFFPLADLRIGPRKYRVVRHLGAIVVTMTVCGFWHGAGWNFLVWGALHGVAIVFAVLWARYLPAPPKLLGWTATVGFFLLTTVLFRAPTFQIAWHVYQGLARVPDPSQLATAYPLMIAAGFALLPLTARELAERMNDKPRNMIAAALALASVVSLIRLGGEETYEFIYFQF